MAIENGCDLDRLAMTRTRSGIRESDGVLQTVDRVILYVGRICKKLQQADVDRPYRTGFRNCRTDINW